MWGTACHAEMASHSGEMASPPLATRNNIAQHDQADRALRHHFPPKRHLQAARRREEGASRGKP